METKRVVVRFRASELRLESVPAYLRAMHGPFVLVILDWRLDEVPRAGGNSRVKVRRRSPRLLSGVTLLYR